MVGFAFEEGFCRAKVRDLEVDLRCPRCGGAFQEWDGVRFTRGFCAGTPYDSVKDYRVGDPLVWRLDRAGRVPTWAYFQDGSANIGDPVHGDLVVREYHEINRCRTCSCEIDGIGVVIRGGVIREFRVFGSLDGLPAGSVSVYGSDGELKACPELDDADHPMGCAVDGGDSERVIAHSDLI